ncbi:M20/M25/M40 family metallo-hydrolase, partial [Cetobacterium sp.]|uniref:M20/M25/M40 family metallo-hydrolase n=1 Tax=Cetobacterium sp. TaxID=2071632 RepID=UPI003EE61138
MNYFDNEGLKEYVINLRRYFHENPEISGFEINTTNKIKSELEKFNISYHELNPITVVAWLGEGDKKIALRGDTDALPLVEEGDKEYISKNSGVMHACGHDGHIAMLLGAAKYLKDIEKTLKGKVYFCF